MTLTTLIELGIVKELTYNVLLIEANANGEGWGSIYDFGDEALAEEALTILDDAVKNGMQLIFNCRDKNDTMQVIFAGKGGVLQQIACPSCGYYNYILFKVYMDTDTTELGFQLSGYLEEN